MLVSADEMPLESSVKKCLSCIGVTLAVIGVGLFFTLLGFNYYGAFQWNVDDCRVAGLTAQIWLCVYACTELLAFTGIIIILGYAYRLMKSIQGRPQDREAHSAYEDVVIKDSSQSNDDSEIFWRILKGSVAFFILRMTRLLVITFLFITGIILVKQCNISGSPFTLFILNLVLMGMTLSDSRNMCRKKQ
jgi:hypothetical protein